MPCSPVSFSVSGSEKAVASKAFHIFHDIKNRIFPVILVCMSLCAVGAFTMLRQHYKFLQTL